MHLQASLRGYLHSVEDELLDDIFANDIVMYKSDKGLVFTVVVVAIRLLANKEKSNKNQRCQSIPGEIAHFRVLHADHAVSTARLGSLSSFHIVEVNGIYKDKKEEGLWRKKE